MTNSMNPGVVNVTAVTLSLPEGASEAIPKGFVESD